MQCSPENSYVVKKKPKYKTQFTINTPIIKMLKKRSNINNNLSCKKHRTHILDLSFRRNNLKIGLSALSKKPPWLLHDLKNFWNFLPDFSRFSLTFQNINHISRFSRFSRLVWTMDMELLRFIKIDFMKETVQCILIWPFVMFIWKIFCWQETL